MSAEHERTEQARGEPFGSDTWGDGASSGSSWSPTLIAYLVAEAAALLAFATPVAVVTSFEGETVGDVAVTPFPQWLVIVGLAIAAAGGRIPVLWPAAFNVALLLVIGGGLLGVFGGNLLIDMWDSDAGGEVRSGAVVVLAAAAAGSAAVIVDCRAHLARLGGSRPDVWIWAVAVATVPLGVTIALWVAAVAVGSAVSNVFAAIAPAVGAGVGALLVGRWTRRPDAS